MKISRCFLVFVLAIFLVLFNVLELGAQPPGVAGGSGRRDLPPGVVEIVPPHAPVVETPTIHTPPQVVDVHLPTGIATEEAERINRTQEEIQRIETLKNLVVEGRTLEIVFDIEDEEGKKEVTIVFYLLLSDRSRAAQFDEIEGVIKKEIIDLIKGVGYEKLLTEDGKALIINVVKDRLVAKLGGGSVSQITIEKLEFKPKR